MSNFPVLEKYFIKQVVKQYDDDLKIFLVESLRRVKYLERQKDQVLVEIAYSM